MRTRPPEISDDQLATILQRAWDFDTASIEYHPHGFGSHHWIVADDDGRKLFLSVDRLEQPFVGGVRTRDVLRRAFETAHALRHLAECEFVVAPERSREGRVLEPIGEQHSLAVFPYVEGTTGEFAEGHGSAAERDAIVDLLADLHSATARVPVSIPGRDEMRVAGEDTLRLALADLDTHWLGGPYAEPAREAFRTHATTVHRVLEHHARLAARLREGEPDWVVTHGEPHPGNVMRTSSGLRLIDWDTVLIAAPERDLAMVDDGSEQVLDRYVRATGRNVDRSALEMYRIRWDLAEIAVYVAQFRSPHVSSEDVESSWRNLNHYLSLEEHWPALTC